MTTVEVEERPPLTLLIPLGSTEQHGPHLPLDTDTRIAEAVAARVAESIADAVIGPTISIGASGEHHGFAGTLSVGTKVLATMLVEMARTAGPEFTRIAVVNAHGGNADAVAKARDACRSEGRELVSWTVNVPGADPHAGHSETSLMLAIAPDLVRLDRAEPGVLSPLSEIMGILIDEGLIGVSDNGVLGDPTTATAEDGREILDRLVANAIRAIGDDSVS